MLLPWLSLFDLRTTFTNFIETKKVSIKWRSDDFVILIPIFNSTKYLTNVSFLKDYRGKVILCTTNLETKEFYKDLYGIADKYGFEVIKCAFEENVKNPWKIYQKTLLAHDYVLGRSLNQLKAKYVIFLDADTTCKADLSLLAGVMERDNLDLASAIVIPSKKETITENLQAIEYHIAMKSRRIYPWLTSGAAMIGKRESLIKIMDRHSLFFNGGDIEIGKLAHLAGLKIDHIPITFYTDVPETFPKLVKQRFSWFCGAFRHNVINAHTNISTPFYAFYFTFVIFLMLPLKIHELFIHWFILPFLFMFYVVVAFATNWKIRSKYMFIFPFYSLFQVIVMPFLGVYRYGKTVIQTKNIGFIKAIRKNGQPTYKMVLNILIIAGLAFFVFNVHLLEGKLYLSNVELFGFVGIDFSDSKPLSIIYNGLKMTAALFAVFLLLFFTFKTHCQLKRYLRKNPNVLKDNFLTNKVHSLIY